MNEKTFLHWLPIEERKIHTIFDGSLQSKMTGNIIIKDFKFLVKADLDKHYKKRRALVILKNQLIELLKNFIPDENSQFNFFKDSKRVSVILPKKTKKVKLKC